MPTIDEIAKDAASHCVERFRGACASSRALTDYDTHELRDIIYKVTLGLLDSSREPPAALVAAVAAAAATPAPEITAGAVVRLRSGGGMMTVGELRRPVAIGSSVAMNGSRSLASMATCHWHDNDGAPRTEMYALAALKLEVR